MTEKLAGVNSILEAIRGRRKIHKIYVQDGRKGKKIEELLELARSKGIYYQEVEKHSLDKMYTMGNHQGIIAQVDTFEYSSIDEMLEHAMFKGQEPFILILDGIEDPQNFGSIIRTAECAGVHGIIIPRHNNSEITAAVARASAGAVEHMRIARETNLVNTIKYLKDQGMWVVGADMDGEELYFSTNIPSPIVLVIGGENRGLRRLVKENCDLLLKIPMQGAINSLNASIAAALMIYETVRQRLQK